MSSGEDYLTGDGANTRIDVRRLVGTLGGSIVLAISAAYIDIVTAIASFNARAIGAIGGFLEDFVEVAVGDNAAVVVEGWRTASTSAAQAGPFAPWVMVLEALVVIAIVIAIWERRPYA